MQSRIPHLHDPPERVDRGSRGPGSRSRSRSSESTVPGWIGMRVGGNRRDSVLVPWKPSFGARTGNSSEEPMAVREVQNPARRCPARPTTRRLRSRELHGLGYRCRRLNRRLPGKPRVRGAAWQQPVWRGPTARARTHRSSLHSPYQLRGYGKLRRTRLACAQFDPGFVPALAQALPALLFR